MYINTKPRKDQSGMRIHSMTGELVLGTCLLLIGIPNTGESW